MLTFLMLTLVFAAPPTASKSAPMIVQPTMPWSQPNVYETYGPRLDNIHYVFEGTPEDSFLALDVGDVDIIDCPLSKKWYDEWMRPERTDIKVMGYGGEYSFYILDIREDESKPVNPPWSTQSYTLFGDPTSVSISLAGEDPYTTTRAAAARRAIAHVIDRTWIVTTVMGGLGEPVYVPAPAAHGGFNSPYVAKYYQDFDKARELLDDAGVVDSDGDGWRDIPGTTEELVLDFFIRIGNTTEQIGNRTEWDIVHELNIRVNHYYGEKADAIAHVMVNGEMDMYTGHWTKIGVPPDHYPYLFCSLGYRQGGFCSNYMKYCGPYSETEHFDPNVESKCGQILTALGIDEVKDVVWAVQEEMMKKENVYTIPLVSTASPKAWRTYMKGTAPVPGNEWKGMVNQTGQGVNNWWTFLNAHTDNMPDPSYGGSITYGVSCPDVEMLNPIYASSPQDWEILDKLYDSLLYLDPIDMATLRPWIAADLPYQLKEYDPVQGEEVSVLYFTLRKDVYFHDGEQLTADDVIFTMSYLPAKLKEREYPPPSWHSNVNRIEKIDDFRIKVYMEYPTWFAQIWVGRNIILPEHVWKPIVDTGDPEAFCPDPTMTGSGPYQMDESDYVSGVSADVYAYTGYFRYSRIQNFVVPGEIGTPVACSSTYWVGESYVGDVKVPVKIYNYDLANDYMVTSTLYANGTLIGQTTVIVLANSWRGVKFAYPVSGGMCTTIGPVNFTTQCTWITPPQPGIYTSTEIIYFQITADGDVISTMDPAPGSPGHVNLFDAFALMNNWGITGAYTYPPADINWDSTVNFLDATIIMFNYGATGH